MAYRGLSPTHDLGNNQYQRRTNSLPTQMQLPATSQLRQPQYHQHMPHMVPTPGQTGRLPLINPPPWPPMIMSVPGTQPLSSIQSLPPSAPQFQVQNFKGGNAPFPRVPLQNFPIPPTLAPIGLGATPTAIPATAIPQQQTMTNYPIPSRGVGVAGGGASKRKTSSKKIKVVDPETMKEVDVTSGTGGGAGGNPSTRSVSPTVNMPRPPPGQPSSTTADMLRQQDIDNMPAVPPNAIIRASKPMPATGIPQQQTMTIPSRWVSVAGGRGLKRKAMLNSETMKEVDVTNVTRGGAGGNPSTQSMSNIMPRPLPGTLDQPSSTTADTFRQQVRDVANKPTITPNAIIRAPTPKTLENEVLHQGFYGGPVTVSAPPVKQGAPPLTFSTKPLPSNIPSPDAGLIAMPTISVHTANRHVGLPISKALPADNKPNSNVPVVMGAVAIPKGSGGYVEESSDLIEQLLGASQAGDLSKVKYLVEVRHVDPHSCRDDEYNATPVHLASQCGHLDVMRYLVEERNCDVECRSKYENTPLQYAALGGSLDIVQYLIRERGCDPMCRGQLGRTPLHDACETASLDVVKYLIEDVKVDSSCRDDDSGATPLHIAALFGSLDVVQYMIEEQQCDVECRDKSEDTPLHDAALGGRLDIVQYLIRERGCDPMCRGWHGRTPLHDACQTGSLDIVKYLIEDVKVDSSCRDENGVTPLHIAAHNGHLSIMKLLVEDYLCDPGVGDARKATPTGRELGSGTYGSVIELTSARETVAGKVFRMSSTVRLQAVANRVCGELIMMTQLHHPNIVQCKGMSLLTDQPLPVLLMEWLMSSLHAYLLHPDNSNLPVERKVCILRDTASGLDYLHSHTPAIIHRDLTAKNVLLDSELRAKIADFGNSRIMDLDPESSPETLTSLPGTLEYMPPEAQGGSVTYDPSLDVFTQTPVQPLPPTYQDDSTGEICGRSEVKRREKFVEAAEQLLSENQSLVVLMKRCLHNNPAQRPRTGELPTRLQEMLTPGVLCAGGEDSLSSTPADTHSPSHGRGPVEVDSETDNSHTEKRNSATGGDTDGAGGEGEGMAVVLSSVPRLVQLRMMRTPDRQKIDIIKTVAPRWRDIGDLLDFDAKGETLKRIQADEGGVESCCRCMFQHWLEGNGVQPVSWATLLEILEDCHFITLAAQVKNTLRPSL